MAPNARPAMAPPLGPGQGATRTVSMSRVLRVYLGLGYTVNIMLFISWFVLAPAHTPPPTGHEPPVGAVGGAGGAWAGVGVGVTWLGVGRGGESV